MKLRRWWCRRFRTTVKATVVSRFQGLVLTPEEWEAVGGWQGAMVPGWHVERPDWWTWGSRSGVSDRSIEAARSRLDEWQDDQAREAGAR